METDQKPRPTVTVVYESMFGNTRRIAQAITAGMGDRVDVVVSPVADAAVLPLSDVLVIGAPTHAHSLSRPESRAEGARWAARSGSRLTLDDEQHSSGIRELLDTDIAARLGYVAFDTRVDMPKIFTGSAATAIAKRLRKKGLSELAPSQSFLVDRDSRLIADELERARLWGTELADAVLGAQAASARQAA
jgi:hypothetical protein